MRRHFLWLVLLALVGCGPVIKDGEVTNRVFSPAHTDTVPVVTTDGFGNTSIQYQDEYIPNRWFLTFKKYDEEHEKWIFREIQVKEETYDKYQVGDYISLQ